MADSPRVTTEALLTTVARMFTDAPDAWWWFVPCATCNARRQQPCQTIDLVTCHPHAARTRAAHVLHGTLWLIVNGYEADVLGTNQETP